MCGQNLVLGSWEEENTCESLDILIRNEKILSLRATCRVDTGRKRGGDDMWAEDKKDRKRKMTSGEIRKISLK